MKLLRTHSTAGRCRVEVSGWDKNNGFFVERSDLEWTEEPHKEVALGRAVSDGAIIFLRPVQTITSRRTRAVPYETEFVRRTPGGRYQFRLRPAPGYPRLEESGGWTH